MIHLSDSWTTAGPPTLRPLHGSVLARIRHGMTETIWRLDPGRGRRMGMVPWANRAEWGLASSGNTLARRFSPAGDTGACCHAMIASSHFPAIHVTMIIYFTFRIRIALRDVRILVLIGPSGIPSFSLVEATNGYRPAIDSDQKIPCHQWIFFFNWRLLHAGRSARPPLLATRTIIIFRFYLMHTSIRPLNDPFLYTSHSTLLFP